jgi:hypothetical protein
MEPKNRLKQLHWIKINERKVASTIWEKMRDEDLDIEFEVIEDLFAAKVVAKVPTAANGDGEEEVCEFCALFRDLFRHNECDCILTDCQYSCGTGCRSRGWTAQEASCDSLECQPLADDWCPVVAFENAARRFSACHHVSGYAHTPAQLCYSADEASPH